MSRLRIYQFAVIAGFILLLEALCLAGFIDKITMPPHTLSSVMTSACCWPGAISAT